MKNFFKLIETNKNRLVLIQYIAFGLFFFASLFTTLTTVTNDAEPYTRMYYRNGSSLELNTLFQFILYLSLLFLHNKTNKLTSNRIRFLLISAFFINFALFLIISVTYYEQWLYRHFFTMTLSSFYIPGRITTYTTNSFGHLMNISIIILLFTSFIFMPFYFASYLKTPKENLTRSKKSFISTNNPKEAAVKIRDLKKLLDEGIISKEVFDEKSKKYIEEL